MWQSWHFWIAMTVLVLGLATVALARWAEHRRTKNLGPRLPSTPLLAIGIVAALVGVALAAEVWRSNPVLDRPEQSTMPLPSDEVAQFKERLSRCWTAPATPATVLAGTTLSLRVMLEPTGQLKAKPEVRRAPVSMSGPALVESATRAVQQCQPYDFMPSAKYQQWKTLELVFSLDGLAAVTTALH
jgi:hypothetical protein